MESEPRLVRKRKKIRYNNPKKTPFFEKRLKILNLSYWEVFVFISVTVILLLGIFSTVIYNALSDYWNFK